MAWEPPAGSYTETDTATEEKSSGGWTPPEDSYVEVSGKNEPSSKEIPTAILDSQTLEEPGKYPTMDSEATPEKMQPKLSGKNLDLISTSTAEAFSKNPTLKEPKNQDIYFSTLLKKGYTLDDVDIIKGNVSKASDATPLTVTMASQEFTPTKGDVQTPYSVKATDSPMNMNSATITDVGGKKTYDVMEGTMNLFNSDPKYNDANNREAYYTELQQKGLPINPVFKNNVENSVQKKKIEEGKGWYALLNPAGVSATAIPEMVKSGITADKESQKAIEEGRPLDAVVLATKGVVDMGLAALTITPTGTKFMQVINAASSTMPKVTEAAMAPVSTIADKIFDYRPTTEAGKAAFSLLDFAAFGVALAGGHKGIGKGSEYVKDLIDPYDKLNDEMKVKELETKFGKLTKTQKENAANLWAEMQLQKMNTVIDGMPQGEKTKYRTEMERLQKANYYRTKNLEHQAAQVPQETPQGIFIPTVSHDVETVLNGVTESQNKIKSDYEQSKKEVQPDFTSTNIAPGEAPKHFESLQNYVHNFDSSQPINEVATGLSVKYKGRNGQLGKSETGEITFTDYSNGKSEIITGGGDATPFNQTGLKINEGTWTDPKTGEKYYVQGDNQGHTVYNVKDGKLTLKYDSDKSNQSRKDAIIRKALNQSELEMQHESAVAKVQQLQTDIEKANNPLVTKILDPKLQAATQEAQALETQVAAEHAHTAGLEVDKINLQGDISQLEASLPDLSEEGKVAVQEQIDAAKKALAETSDDVPDPIIDENPSTITEDTPIVPVKEPIVKPKVESSGGVVDVEGEKVGNFTADISDAKNNIEDKVASIDANMKKFGVNNDASKLLIKRAIEKVDGLSVNNVFDLAQKIAKNDNEPILIQHIVEAIQYEVGRTEAEKDAFNISLDDVKETMLAQNKQYYPANKERMEEIGITEKSYTERKNKLKKIKKQYESLPEKSKSLVKQFISRYYDTISEDVKLSPDEYLQLLEGVVNGKEIEDVAENVSNAIRIIEDTEAIQLRELPKVENPLLNRDNTEEALRRLTSNELKEIPVFSKSKVEQMIADGLKKNKEVRLNTQFAELYDLPDKVKAIVLNKDNTISFLDKNDTPIKGISLSKSEFVDLALKMGNAQHKSAYEISRLYHETKADSSNPELVKAVEQSLKETAKAGSGGVGGDVRPDTSGEKGSTVETKPGKKKTVTEEPTNTNKNATTQGQEPNQEINQQAGISEHQGTGTSRNQTEESQTDSGNSGSNSTGTEKEKVTTTPVGEETGIKPESNGKEQTKTETDQKWRQNVLSEDTGGVKPPVETDFAKSVKEKANKLKELNKKYKISGTSEEGGAQKMGGGINGDKIIDFVADIIIKAHESGKNVLEYMRETDIYKGFSTKEKAFAERTAAEDFTEHSGLIGATRKILSMEAIERNLPEDKTYFQGSSNKEAWDRVIKKITEDPNLPTIRQQEIIAEALAGERPRVSDDDVLIQLYEKARLEKEHRSVTKEINQAIIDGDEQKRVGLLPLRESIQNMQLENVAAIRTIGSTGGKLLGSIQTLTDTDFSYNKLVNDATAEKGTPLTDAEKKKYAEMASEMESLRQELKDIQTRKDAEDAIITRRNAEQRAKEDAALIEKIRAEIKTEKGNIKSTKATTTAKQWATNVRKLKTKPFKFTDENGVTHDVHTMGATWNDLVESTAKAIEAGGVFADHLTDLIKNNTFYQSLSETDKNKFAKQLEEAANEFNESKKIPSFSSLSEKAIEESGGEFHADLKGIVKKMLRAAVEESPELQSIAHETSPSEIYKEAVDRIYESLKEGIHDLERRQVADLVSGYGEYKLLPKDDVSTAMRIIKQEEQADAVLKATEENKLPLHSGSERQKQNQQVREKRAQAYKNIKDKGLEPPITKEEEVAAFKSAEQKYQQTLKNAIEDLDKEIKTGIKKDRASGKKEYTSPETKDLQRIKEELEKIRDEKLGSPKFEQKIKATQDLIDKNKKIIDGLKKGKLPEGMEPSVKTKDGKTIFGLKKAAADKIINQKIQVLEDFNQNLKDEISNLLPDEVKKQAVIDKYRKQRERRKALLEKQIKENNYAPKPTKEPPPFDKAIAEINEKIRKLEFQNEDQKQAYKNENKGKMAQWIHNAQLLFKANIFFDYKGIAKLSLAPLARFVEKAPTELAKYALSHTPGIKEAIIKDPSGYTPNLIKGKNSALGATREYYKGIHGKQTYGNMIGKTTFEYAASEYSNHSLWELMHSDKPHSSTSFAKSKVGKGLIWLAEKPQQTHGFIKTFPKMAELRSSYMKAIDNFANMIDSDTGKPYDITDPNVQQKAMRMAEVNALTDIYMNDNAFASNVNEFIRKAVESGKIDQQLLGAFLSQEMPIVKIPANFYAEMLHRVPLVGTLEALAQLKRSGEKGAAGKEKGGIKNLTPEQAANVRRLLVHQVIGGMYYAAAVVLYEKYGDELIDKIKDVKYWLHNTGTKMLLMALELQKNEDRSETFVEESEGIPAVRLAKDITKVAWSKDKLKTLSKKGQEMAVRLITPTGLSNLAAYIDDDLQRDPQTMLELIEMRIPGLRENVTPKIVGIMKKRSQETVSKTDEEKAMIEAKKDEKEKALMEIAKKLKIEYVPPKSEQDQEMPIYNPDAPKPEPAESPENN